MNSNVWHGKWKQARGAVVQAWGRITRDRLLVFIGKQDAVNGRIQERVGRLHASRCERPSATILPFRR